MLLGPFWFVGGLLMILPLRNFSNALRKGESGIFPDMPIVDGWSTTLQGGGRFSKKPISSSGETHRTRSLPIGLDSSSSSSAAAAAGVAAAAAAAAATSAVVPEEAASGLACCWICWSCC